MIFTAARRLAIRLLGAGLLTAAAIGLTACNGGVNTTQIDSTISSQQVQTGIQFACLALTGAEAGWNAYVAANPDKVPADDIHNANVAIAGVASLCVAPYPQNTADVVAKVIAAAVTVTQALQNQNKPATTPAATTPATGTTTTTPVSLLFDRRRQTEMG